MKSRDEVAEIIQTEIIWGRYTPNELAGIVSSMCMEIVEDMSGVDHTNAFLTKYNQYPHDYLTEVFSRHGLEYKQ